MDKKEVNRLVIELNKLSEFQEYNKKKMEEIAHVLVTYYMQ